MTEKNDSRTARNNNAQTDNSSAASETRRFTSAKAVYLGHGSLRFDLPDGGSIYVDPFSGSDEDYTRPADLILRTHDHFDHTAFSRIKKQNPGCRTITEKEALSGGEYKTFDLGFVKAEAVAAGNNKNHDIKKCVGYVLTFPDGGTVYISGDTSKTAQMEELGRRGLDYAFFCCDGVYNMGPEEASECAAIVKAGHSIPYHMLPAKPGNDFNRRTAEKFKNERRLILAPGEGFDI
ncbi:MAG: MBL fold metallo-hydrolase [Eubacterium sp.]|jgi:L-ascorbate metabolism protein UlaG (beta-lactamase superfamily)